MSTKTYDIPQGKFVFKAKANEAGERALYLQYVINSTPVFRTTGVFVKEGNFDSKKQCIKSGAFAARTNNELQVKKRKVDTQIADFLHGGGILTKEIVKLMLEGSYAPADNAKKIDLVKYALDYNERRYLSQEITEKTRYNHEKVDDRYMNALEENGFHIPAPIKEHPTDLRETNHYDQIAFNLHMTDTMQIFDEKVQRAGSFNFTKSVYNEGDYDAYIPLMDAKQVAKGNVQDYFRKTWRTFQMSDHLPLWVELKVDFSGQYLEDLKKKYATTGKKQ